MNKNRDMGLDVLRVTAMLFVLLLHAPGKEYLPSSADSLLTTVLLTCNILFFMLSGRLNLGKDLDSPAQVLAFYYRKFVSILLPLGITVALTYGEQVIFESRYLSVGSLYGELIGTASYSHLWYVYGLTGLLLSTPILGKAFRHMSDGELKIVFGVGLLWGAVSLYCAEDLGFTFGFSGWTLAGWGMAYFMGYYVHRVIHDQNKKYVYLAGAAGLAVTLAGMQLLGDRFRNARDLSPAYQLFGMALYVLLSSRKEVRSAAAEKGIRFLSRHSYSVYLLHMLVNGYLLYGVVIPGTAWLSYLGSFCISTVITVAIAAAFDELLLFPLQKLLYGLIGKKERKQV